MFLLRKTRISFRISFFTLSGTLLLALGVNSRTRSATCVVTEQVKQCRRNLYYTCGLKLCYTALLTLTLLRSCCLDISSLQSSFSRSLQPHSTSFKRNNSLMRAFSPLSSSFKESCCFSCASFCCLSGETTLISRRSSYTALEYRITRFLSLHHSS